MGDLRLTYGDRIEIQADHDIVMTASRSRVIVPAGSTWVLVSKTELDGLSDDRHTDGMERRQGIPPFWGERGYMGMDGDQVPERMKAGQRHAEARRGRLTAPLP